MYFIKQGCSYLQSYTALQGRVCMGMDMVFYFL